MFLKLLFFLHIIFLLLHKLKIGFSSVNYLVD